MKMVSKWTPVIADYERYLAKMERPDTTIELRRNQLRYLAKSLNMPMQQITEQDLLDWFGRHQWKAETRRSYRAGIRGFFSWAHKCKIIETDPASGLPTMKPAIPIPRPAPDAVWATATMAADARVMLMLRLAGEAGLRRGEVARVNTGDLLESAKGYQLHVHGKGRRDRLVPVTDGLAALIAAGAAGHTPGAATTGWLFPGSDHGHLTAPWVGALCSRVMPGVWTLHTARHRFATRAYHGKKDIRAVQKLLGHSSVAMTERYTFVDDDDLRAAMMSAVA